MSKKNQKPEQDEVLENQVDPVEEVEETESVRPSKKDGAKPRNPKEEFRSAMQVINTALAENPGVIDIIKVKRPVQFGDSELTRDVYAWADQTGEAKKARKKIKDVLNDAWQSGALNYAMIARAIRVEDLSVQALLDSEFIEANGL